MAFPQYRPISASSLADEQEVQDHTASPTQRNEDRSAFPETSRAFLKTSDVGLFGIPRKPVAVAAVDSIHSSKAEELEQPLPESHAPGFSYSEDWWLLEILGALLSLLCLAAMIVVLTLYKEKPLSHWNLPIRINSLISLFASLAKAAILLPIAACIGQLKWRHFATRGRQLNDFQTFDSASRGPLGALELIIRLKRTSLMATCASLMVIVSLAIDPFAQQIISYPVHTVPVANDSASMLQTQVYDTNMSANNRMATYIRMQGAIYRGLYGLPSETLYTCPTGNCNWTSLATFGVCSECVRVTDQTQRSCFNYTDGTRLEPTDPNRTDWPLACNYTTPSKFNLWSWSGMSGVGTYNTVINSTAVVGRMSGTDDTTISSLAALRLSESDGFGLPFGEVDECRFYWCAKTYSDMTVTGGVLDMGNPVITNLTIVSNWFGGNDASYAVMKVPEGIDYEFNRTFTINSNDAYNTGYFLADLFTVQQFSYAAYNNDPGTVSIGSALQQASSLGQLVADVADSMTNRMRAINNGTRNFGVTIQDVTFIHVRWAWLSLPAGLILCGCVLLVILIFVGLTGRPKLVVWKSSSLASLFHGPQSGQGFPASSSPLTISDMDSTAKRIQVQLGAAGPGNDLKLMKVD
ncbi:hypothetical protein H2200_001834 [Cladophialophora chaetospira]|uniref:Uncharacterized protein n=1 Tax=Cladophialophora chaetospira TaxID=386627 RepID=A0AA39CQ16_9EURO|nr:hypothetical protein H2200_001834 [Cladophialophora chaetospira]